MKLCFESSGEVEGITILLGYSYQTASAKSIGSTQWQNSNTSPVLAASVPSFLSPRVSAAIKGASPNFIDQASFHLVNKACCIRKHTDVSPPRRRLILTNTMRYIPDPIKEESILIVDRFLGCLTWVVSCLTPSLGTERISKFVGWLQSQAPLLVTLGLLILLKQALYCSKKVFILSGTLQRN